MRYTFDELMRKAEIEAGGVDVPTRPAILKELLHYSILQSLSRSSLADRIVFQGGTALRLCYGGNRYSEDLDFVCGADAKEPFDISDMATLLRQDVADTYGLTVDVREPKANRSFDDDGITVKRWSININVPGFAAAQKIHFEVCNVPAHDPKPMMVEPRYGFLSDVYNDIALRVESEAEIYADKAVALIARSHVKNRDLWDLMWLHQRGRVLDVDLVKRKLDDYGVEDVGERIAQQRARLLAPEAERSFVNEMIRFVTPSLARQLTSDAGAAKERIDHALKQLVYLEIELGDRSPTPWT